MDPVGIERTDGSLESVRSYSSYISSSSDFMLNYLIQFDLPSSFEEWPNYDSNSYWKPWEQLRPFFLSHGYKLYERTPRNELRLVPLGTVHVDKRQPNAFGVYGTHSFVPYYSSIVRVDLVCSRVLCDS
jgi:hypothetical protein